MDQLFTISDCILLSLLLLLLLLLFQIGHEVQEVLREVKAKPESLGLESTDLVFDHAIYAETVAVLTNPANKD